MMTFEYAPAPESTAIVKIKSEYGLFINGKFVPAKGGKTFTTINPATEETLTKVAFAAPSDVDKAVAAARTAYSKVWSKMPAAERGKYLFRIARILQERAREFAVLETMDNGKPIRETRDIDIPLAAAHFFYHAGWADKLEHAGVGSSPKPHAHRKTPHCYRSLDAMGKRSISGRKARPSCTLAWSVLAQQSGEACY